MPRTFAASNREPERMNAVPGDTPLHVNFRTIRFIRQIPEEASVQNPAALFFVRFVIKILIIESH